VTTPVGRRAKGFYFKRREAGIKMALKQNIENGCFYFFLFFFRGFCLVDPTSGGIVIVGETSSVVAIIHPSQKHNPRTTSNPTVTGNANANEGRRPLPLQGIM
jgi:hypothetical protein